MDYWNGNHGYVDQVIGIDMIGNGITEYQEGVILTQMGMTNLGLAQMEIGQMQMVQGQALIGVKIMENNMGIGYKVGYGMDPCLGITSIGEEIALTNQSYSCMGFGCTYPCCLKRCTPNCMLQCCQNKIIVIQSNNPEYQNMYNQNQQAYQSKQIYQNQQAYQNQQNYQQPNQIIYAGSVYRKEGCWHLNQNFILKSTHFGNQSLQSISKLKIKSEKVYNQCTFLKTSHHSVPDRYYAVSKHDQINWFCSIIWAKLKLGQYKCNLYSQFNGSIQGRILRKSLYLGEWAYRDVVIDGQGLRSYRNIEQMPTTTMYAIPEIWTRFEFIEQGTCLVIKLHHEGNKYEYGIPLHSAILWIRAFCSLL